MSILLSKETTFIVQGITGREAVNLTRECLDYGSKVVGGVTPGRKGREVHGVPVFDTVAQAVEHHGAPIDGSVVTVPPAFTKDAVFEAILNGIKLIVIVTERIPRGDVAQMVELADREGARIIGPNCLGLIVPDVCKMGGIGGPAKDAAKAYAPGPVGVMSRSGGMTTEISSSLTQAGLGVSTAVSIGGDAIIGSTYAELMPFFEADEQTKAIVIYTEPGGRMEAQLAEWVADNNSRLPIVAFMAGKFMDDEEMKGMSFGHAGTIVEGAEDTATAEDLPPRSRRHPRRRADRRDPHRGQGEARGARLMATGMNKSSSTSRSTTRSAATPRSPPSSKKSAPSTSSRTRAARSRSSTPTSTSASSAASASRRPPRAPCTSRSSTTAPSFSSGARLAGVEEGSRERPRAAPPRARTTGPQRMSRFPSRGMHLGRSQNALIHHESTPTLPRSAERRSGS